MAESPPTLVETYARTSESTRSTARWVMTSLGGVGALLVAGLSLTSLTGVDSVGRLLLAGAAVVVALVGVAWAVGQTAAVLKPSTVKFEDIVAAEGDSASRPSYMDDVFRRKEVFLQHLAPSFAELYARFITAQGERARAWQDFWEHPADSGKEKVAEAKEANMTFYRGAMLTITASAAAAEIRARASTMQQLLAAGLVMTGVVGFALVVAWPVDRPKADLHGANLTGVDLTGVQLSSASFRGMKLTRVRLIDADLRDADFRNATLDRVSLLGAHTRGAQFGGVTWRAVVCPDGTLSDRAGNTCEAHLTAAITDSVRVVTHCRQATIDGRPACIGLNLLCVHTSRANRDYRRFGLRCGRRVGPGRYRLVAG